MRRGADSGRVLQPLDAGDNGGVQRWVGGGFRVVHLQYACSTHVRFARFWCVLADPAPQNLTPRRPAGGGVRQPAPRPLLLRPGPGRRDGHAAVRLWGALLLLLMLASPLLSQLLLSSLLPYPRLSPTDLQPPSTNRPQPTDSHLTNPQPTPQLPQVHHRPRLGQRLRQPRRPGRVQLHPPLLAAPQRAGAGRRGGAVPGRASGHGGPRRQVGGGGLVGELIVLWASSLLTIQAEQLSGLYTFTFIINAHRIASHKPTNQQRKPGSSPSTASSSSPSCSTPSPRPPPPPACSATRC